MVLDIELVVESGGPPVQRANEVLAGTKSKGQGQDIRDGEVGSRVSEALGRLVCGKAEADGTVSVTRVYGKALCQILGEVGKGGLENGGN